MSTLTRSIVFVTVVLTLVLVGCSASGDSSPSAPVELFSGEPDRKAAEDMAAEEMMAQAAEAPMPTDGQSMPLEDFLSVAVAQAQTRVIIYTGDISLIVRDTEESVADITTLAEAQGGFVASANIYESGDALRGTITIRVSADRYQETMAKLRDLSLRVERESSSTQDVTEEFTDLQARKTNLEFTEEALQKLLDERQRVGSTSDILEVYRELTAIRGQIEQIEGRLRYLANQSALSTINIQLTPDIVYQPITAAGWQPQGVAREALEALITALEGLANLTIWLVIFVLPLGLVFLIPLVIVFLVIQGWWRRRQAGRKVAAAATSTGQSKEKEIPPDQK